jgi:two-component system, OmpR family, sensor histidine kinase CpxA
MRFRPSLSLKIFLLAFLNVLLLAIVFFFFARYQYRLDLDSFLLAPARDRMLSVSRLIALELPQQPQSRWEDLLARYSKSAGAQIYLFDDQGTQLAGPSVTLPAPVLASLVHGHRGGRDVNNRIHIPPMLGPPPIFLNRIAPDHEYWVGVPIPIWNAVQPRHGAAIWHFASLWNNTFFFDYRPWLAVILAIVVISVACWLPLIRGLTRTIGQITKATAQIARGHFEIALPEKRRDELGRLSVSINSMAHRLSDLIHGQRRFLSDIAHELSSPVARMQVALGILEQRATGSASDYVKDVAEEATHMSSLINELLSFSKSQMAREIGRVPVNVAEVARRAVSRECPSPSQVEMEIAADLEVLAEPEFLYRSLANLLRNAVRYAAAAGPILLRAKNTNGSVSIYVTDNGPGLPEEELENVFKPFYRPEFARQRETGGAGLGLAIVRSCIEACGGSVCCRNRKPHGLEVEMTLAQSMH